MPQPSTAPLELTHAQIDDASHGHAPLMRVTLPGTRTPVWLAARYDVVKAALGDSRFVRDPAKVAGMEGGGVGAELLDGAGLPPEYRQYREILVMIDGPEHTRLRTHVMRAFAPRRTAALRPRIERIAEDLTEALAAKASEFDLLSAFAYPLMTNVAFGFYGDARREIGHDLRTLAVAAQGDRADERTVESLTDNFAEYQERIGRALENDARAGGKAAALDDYRTATDLLQGQLLPEARTLVDSNNQAFNAEYAQARSTLAAQLAAVVALGLLLLAGLGVLQWYLARRFHRILNPGVLAATVCALLAVLLGGQALAASAEHLRVARHDAFDSVVALSRARAIASDANADESRYLLDPERRDQYAQAFLAKSQKLYGIQGANLATYDDALDRTWLEYRRSHDHLEFTGEFRRELDNITFAGERAAAETTVVAYSDYQRDDRKIRALVAQGKEREAVEFCMDWQPGTSNAHFGAWMAALDKVTDINRRHFTASVDAGRSEATGLLPWTCGLLLAAGVLTLLGLRPRLAEFR